MATDDAIKLKPARNKAKTGIFRRLDAQDQSWGVKVNRRKNLRDERQALDAVEN